MWFSIFVTIVFVCFMLPISLNMIKIIRLSLKRETNEIEDDQIKRTIRRKFKLSSILIVLLVIVMFFSFFLNYLFTH